MNDRFFVSLCLCGVSAVLSCGAARAVRVDYTVTVRPKADRIRVEADLRDLPAGEATVAIPAWFPGYYVPTRQAEGVSGLSVTSNGAPLTTERASPTSWSFANHDGSARVEYEVAIREYGLPPGDPALSLGQMGVYVDGDLAFLQPGAALVYVPGHEDAPSTLRLNLPDGWQSTAPLPRDASGAFAAPSYHALNDSPIQAGKHKRLSFTERGREFEVILTGKPRVKDAMVLDVCRRAAAAALELFDGYVPFERYQFHLHFPPKRAYPGGGLEHAASTVIVFGSHTDEKAFRLYGARLIVHELIHAWNVKALRPEGLGEIDYQEPPRTPSLWLAEGVTDYQAHLALARSGLWTERQALDSLAEMIDRYLTSPGRSTTSLAASSEGVSGAGPASHGSGGTNYYTKGLLAAWVLDTEVRAATGNRRSLDDAMRHMMRTYAEKDRPYPPDALLTSIRDSCGVDVSDTYRAAVHGTGDLPLETAAERMGMRLAKTQRPDPMMGVSLERTAGGLIVREVVKGSAADRAGIRKGDALSRIGPEPIAAAGEALLPGLGQPLLAGLDVGDRAQFMAERGLEKEIVTVIVQARPATALEGVKEPTRLQQDIFDGLWGKPSR